MDILRAVRANHHYRHADNGNRCHCRRRRRRRRRRHDHHDHHDHQLRLITNATNSPCLLHTKHLKVRHGKYTFPSPEWDQVSLAILANPAKR